VARRLKTNRPAAIQRNSLNDIAKITQATIVANISKKLPDSLTRVLRIIHRASLSSQLSDRRDTSAEYRQQHSESCESCEYLHFGCTEGRCNHHSKDRDRSENEYHAQTGSFGLWRQVVQTLSKHVQKIISRGARRDLFSTFWRSSVANHQPIYDKVTGAAKVHLLRPGSSSRSPQR
jgi:hypothetical protein